MARTEEWDTIPPDDVPCRDQGAAFFTITPRGRGKTQEGTALARVLCRNCLYREPCLEYLLRWPDQYGYGAGMTSEQRLAERRRRARVARFVADRRARAERASAREHPEVS